MGPSANACTKLQVYTTKGAVDYPQARALDAAELPGIAQQYADAASNALEAGEWLAGLTQSLCCGYWHCRSHISTVPELSCS